MIVFKSKAKTLTSNPVNILSVWVDNLPNYFSVKLITLFFCPTYWRFFYLIYLIGDFEVFFAVISVSILAVIIYNVITVLSFKDILRRFGFMKIARRDFYECGFKPQTQRPIKVSLQFLLICVFFLLYDIELVFLFPFVSGFTFTGLYDLLLLILFFLVLFLSLCIDYERHALFWQE
jgi:NADH:ubiquinone oxidoreductase subunit 3 (subunit A)